jgi:hypothetical protein
MYVGTVLEGHGTVWLARKVEQSMNTALLESQDGTRTESVGFEEVEAAGYRVVCLPIADWPSVALRPHPRGRLREVLVASLQGERPLRRFSDWMKLDEFQLGGALYLNPELGLGYRDRLILSFDNGRFPTDIPRDFQSLRVKQARLPSPTTAAAAKKGGPDLFDHLLDDDL